VVNQYNDNYDHFYVKTADASRVYGLELEHLLSPNRINYLMHRGGTLVEEHIAGVPGDAFIRDYLGRPTSTASASPRSSSNSASAASSACSATCAATTTSSI
jgi:hypothetical protein